MSRRLILITLVVLVLGALLAGTAFAQTPIVTKQVGLVIAFPDGNEHLEIVTVPAKATTFDVLQEAKIDLASADAGYGPGVCGINDFGCPATNCFCDAAHYWAYFDLDAATLKWVASSMGAGSVVPANGAVVGFAWSGFDASYNPNVQPPVYTFAQIVAKTTPPPVSVPEPTTILLLGSGLAGVAAYARARKTR